MIELSLFSLFHAQEFICADLVSFVMMGEETQIYILWN